jgi:hypothetical protein
MRMRTFRRRRFDRVTALAAGFLFFADDVVVFEAAPFDSDAP